MQLRRIVTFEYFHPYRHYPEALIYQTSDSLDRILVVSRSNIYHRLRMIYRLILIAGFRMSCFAKSVGPRIDQLDQGMD